MEASKLHNIIYDAIAEENNLKFSSLVNDLIEKIELNKVNEVENLIKKAESSLSDSVFNTYSVSNKNILKEINGFDFFGEPAVLKVKEILERSSYKTPGIVTNLRDYLNTRNEFLKHIRQVRAAFPELNIPIHYNDEEYELGLLLPSNSNYEKIKELNRELTRWDKAIKSYRELVGLGTEDTKITLVSNGSLEFFTENPEHVALCISFTLERLFKLYKRILDVREAWKTIRNSGIPKSQEKTIKKHEKDIYEKEIDSIVRDVVKRFASNKIDSGRLNELKISIKGHTNYFARCIDDGLIIEITPPEISEPDILKEEETKENKKERNKAKSDYDKQLETVKSVREGLRASADIYALGKEVFKMISSGDIQNENSEEDGKDDESN